MKSTTLQDDQRMKMNLKKWDPKSKQAKEAYKYFKESMDFYDRKLIRNWLNSGQIEILAVIYEFSYKKEIYEKRTGRGNRKAKTSLF